MALILQRSRFLHVPKTGGTWATRALTAACVVLEDFRIGATDHTTLAETPHPDKFTFAFVRHPLTWWQSMWRFHQGPARRYVVSHKVCSRCWSEDFGEFMASVLEHFPGEYGRMVEHFLGAIGAGVDFVGRQERLVDDLLLALALAGEPCDEAAVRAVAPLNVSEPVPARYTPELERAVLEAEAGVLARFGYGRPPRDPAAAAAWLGRSATAARRRPSRSPRVAKHTPAATDGRASRR